MTLDGSVRLSQHDAFPCRSEDVSPGGMCVTAPVPIAPGTRIVLQFEQLGRLVGFARRSTGATFGVVLHAATEERERLTAKLTWLVNRS